MGLYIRLSYKVLPVDYLCDAYIRELDLVELKTFTECIFLSDDFGNLKRDDAEMVYHIHSARSPMSVVDVTRAIDKFTADVKIAEYVVRGTTYILMPRHDRYQPDIIKRKAYVKCPVPAFSMLSEQVREKFGPDLECYLTRLFNQYPRYCVANGGDSTTHSPKKGTHSPKKGTHSQKREHTPPRREGKGREKKGVRTPRSLGGIRGGGVLQQAAETPAPSEVLSTHEIPGEERSCDDLLADLLLLYEKRDHWVLNFFVSRCLSSRQVKGFEARGKLPNTDRLRNTLTELMLIRHGQAMFEGKPLPARSYGRLLEIIYWSAVKRRDRSTVTGFLKSRILRNWGRTRPP